jgi:hypothetical protein
MTVLRPAPILALVVLLSAGVASAALSPSDYRAKANAACAQAQAQLKALPNAQSSDYAAMAKELPAAVTIWTQEYTALQALKPPPALLSAHRHALWARWDSLSGAMNAVKQLNSGANPETAINAWRAKLIGLTMAEAFAWKTAGVSTCERAA